MAAKNHQYQFKDTVTHTMIQNKSGAHPWERGKGGEFTSPLVRDMQFLD